MGVCEIMGWGRLKNCIFAFQMVDLLIGEHLESDILIRISYKKE